MPATVPGSLLIDGKEIRYEHICKGQFPSGLPPWALDTLAFCREWLTGLESFSLFTSGSTGTPKKISFSREQMAISACMTGKALGLQTGDKALVNLPTQYIAGRMMLVRGFELGLYLTIIPPSSLPLNNFPEDTWFDFLSFVPLQLQTILAQAPEKIHILNRAKAILAGGAPVSFILHKQLQEIQAPVYHTYGMTETVSHIALRRLNGTNQTNYFTALDGVKLATDDRGCLVIHTALAGNVPVITNDLVNLLSPSTFEWLGRIDFVINTGGVKVQAEKVERAVEQVFVQMQVERRFFVSALPDDLFGEKVTLVIEGTLLDKPSEEKLNELLLSLLSKFELPKAIVYMPVFKETPTGKVVRKETINVYLENSGKQ